MNTIIEQVKHQYKWDLDYAKTVAFEYERFLELRCNNEKLSPSDDIDKFWHQHILNTSHYMSYCLEKFRKFVHHNPMDSFDQSERLKRLENTRKIYTNKYGNIVNKHIWMIDDIPSKSDKPAIKVKIIYTFDDGTGYRKWRKNNNTYDKKTLLYHFMPNETIKNLKFMISKKTGHNYIAVKLYPENIENISHLTGWANDLSDNILLSSVSYKSINLRAELEEMTQNGYC